jgi:cell division transport system permease protein
VKFLAAQRYASRRTLAMMGERPLAFILSVLLAASALALPLAVASVGWATRPVIGQVQPAPEVSVFIATRATPRDVDGIKARLARLPGVTNVTLRSKETALAQLADKSGFSSPSAELGVNPLPDVLIARLSLQVPAESIEGSAREIRTWPLVDAVRTDLDWYRKVRAFTRLAVTATALFGALVVALIALILLGTVRLHAGTRAEEAAVLKLVGATTRFIARPYAYSSTLTMIIAASIAVAAVYAVHFALRGPIADLTALYGVPFTLPNPEPLHLAVVILGAGIFGWLVGLIGARAALSAR